MLLLLLYCYTADTAAAAAAAAAAAILLYCYTADTAAAAAITTTGWLPSGHLRRTLRVGAEQQKPRPPELGEAGRLSSPE